MSFAWSPIDFPFAPCDGLNGAAIRYGGLPTRGDLATLALSLPPDLERSAPARQCDYVAGRICAREALQALRGANEPGYVGRLADGGPQWPEGTTGSISHSEGIAVAVAGLAGRYPVIGVDVQRLLQAGECEMLRAQILPEDSPNPRGWSDATFLTLAFSAKESLFKALAPHADALFGFEAAAWMGMRETERVFELRLLREVGRGWPAGRAVGGRYHLGDGWVMTAVGF